MDLSQLEFYAFFFFFVDVTSAVVWMEIYHFKHKLKVKSVKKKKTLWLKCQQLFHPLSPQRTSLCYLMEYIKYNVIQKKKDNTFLVKYRILHHLRRGAPSRNSESEKWEQTTHAGVNAANSLFTVLFLPFGAFSHDLLHWLDLNSPPEQAGNWSFF